MARYRVRLLKTVCNDAGREAQVVQKEFELEAPSGIEALKAAKARYCSLKRVSDCSFFVDGFQVERLSWCGGTLGDGNRVRVASLTA